MEKLSKILLAMLIIASAAFLFVTFWLPFTFEGNENDFYEPVVTGGNITTYKNSCSELNTSQVLKDPYSLVGQKVKVKGQILKKNESEQFGTLRTNIVLKVPELQDPILVTYPTIVPFKQDDFVTVYGEYYYPAKDETVPELKNKDLAVIKSAYIEKS